MSINAIYGVVRDKNGKIRVDDPAQLHPFQLALMSKDERVELGFTADAYAVTAQGMKELTRAAGGWTCAERLVACNFVIDLGVAREESAVLQLDQRRDVRAGGVIPDTSLKPYQRGA